MISLLDVFLIHGVVATINQSFERELQTHRIRYEKQVLDDITIFRLIK